MSIILLWAPKVLLFSVLVLGVLYLMTRNKRAMLMLCLVLFIFSVGGGFIIYSYSHLPYRAGLADAPFAALRGIFSTARMFFINEDFELFVSAVGEDFLDENTWLKVFFWLIHISAMIVIQAALISLFGRRLLDYFRLRWGSHREVYIIKGSDKYAFMLGENIATHDLQKEEPDSNRLIILLIGEDDDEKKLYEKATHFGGIVQVLDRNRDLIYYLKKTGLERRIQNKRKHNIILTSNNPSISDDARLIAKFAKERGIKPENLDIYIFVSSEWDKERIEEITQAMEGEYRKYPYTFHIINEIDLSIRQMIKKHPPYKCQRLNFSNGVAKHDFTVMILGFGKVGQAALLWLTMNGQFVGSHMRAMIIDKDIDNLRDCFLYRHPSLKDLCCDIEFHNYDVQCDKFFKLLSDSGSLDYVVVALSSDELNKRTTQDIKLHYERKDVKILPFIAVSEKNGKIHNENEDSKIFTFGCREEIYKDDEIIRERSDVMAKAVNETYRKIHGDGNAWHNLIWYHQESSRAAADFIPAMLHLVSPKLKESDVMNKEVLTDDQTLAEILAQTEHLRWNAFHAAMGYRPMSVEEMIRRFNEKKDLKYSRQDNNARLHVCLANWDALDNITEAYRELERRAGFEPKGDFKNSDRAIISNIPKFLMS